MPPEAIQILDRALAALGVLAGAALTYFFAGRRESAADRRARRDARLARLRVAFEPAILAAWAMQTAVGEVFIPSRPREEMERELASALTGINQARAQLLLEGADDVLEALTRMYSGFRTFVTAIRAKNRTYTADDVKAAWTAVHEGRVDVERLIRARLRAEEAR